MNWFLFLSIMITFAILVTAKLKQLQITDPKLDIALMFDDSSDMKLTEFDRVYNGLRRWIKGYYIEDRPKVTRFSIIRCGNQEVKLRFQTINSTAEEIAKLIPDSIPRSATGSFKDCFETVLNVFTEKSGNRSEAPDIVLCKI